MDKNKSQGQAFVEWSIFGFTILILWVCSLHLANKLLTYAAINGWSLVAARQALSHVPTKYVNGIKIKKQTEPIAGSAQVTIGERSAIFSLKVPQINGTGGKVLKKDLWSSLLSSFGFP